MQTAHETPEDWRQAVNRLREESAAVLRELFSGHAPFERGPSEGVVAEHRAVRGRDRADERAG